MTGPSVGTLQANHDRAPVVLDPVDWAHWPDPSKDAAELMMAVRPMRFEVREAA